MLNGTVLSVSACRGKSRSLNCLFYSQVTPFLRLQERLFILKECCPGQGCSFAFLTEGKENKYHFFLEAARFYDEMRTIPLDRWR